MKIAVICCSLSLLITEGCSTQSKSRNALFQSTVTAASCEALTIDELDHDNTQKAHEEATFYLSWRLDDLRSFTNGVTKDELDSRTDLARSILKHATNNQAQLLQDKYSLQMITTLKSLLTDPSDIRRASDLAAYLKASGTNQVPPWSP
jgi:hypothetical protein